MPAHTGALLAPEERTAFGEWLGACVKRAGVSKKAIAHELGGDTVQRFNRYLHGVVPTLPVLAKIVTCLDVSPVVALWRAGYFRELLGHIDAFSKDASPFDLNLIIAFAVAAFPRRELRKLSAFDLPVGANAFLIDFISLPDVNLEQLGAELHLHPLLKHASDALAFRDVPPQARRFAAAEYVNAWADQIDFERAESWRSTIAGSAEEQIPTPQPTSTSRFHGERVQ